MIKEVELSCINLETYTGMKNTLNKELAEIIIEGRREVGGFNSIGQLLEIEEIDGDMLAEVSRHYTVKTNTVDYKYFKIKLEGEDLDKAKRLDYIISYEKGNSIKDASKEHEHYVEIIFAPMMRKHFREGTITTYNIFEGDPFDIPFELEE